MITALKILAVVLFAVSLLCGTAAMAHGGGEHAGMAHGAASDDHASAPDCDDCGTPDAQMSCSAMLGHCAPAIAGTAGLTVIARVVLPDERDLPVDLVLIGAGPDFDTPPPRG